MTRERIYELERYATDTIEECQLLGKMTDNNSLAFWRGVKVVVDELKMGLAKAGPGKPFC